MSKTRLLSIAVVVLIGINMIILYVVFVRPAPSNKPDPREVVIETLHFDSSQVAAYTLLINQHKEAIQAADVQMRKLKHALNATLVEDNSASKDSIINAINAIQKEIEYIHYHHFVAIKQLCTPAQKPYFNELTREFARIFAPAHKKNHHPPRD